MRKLFALVAGASIFFILSGCQKEKSVALDVYKVWPENNCVEVWETYNSGQKVKRLCGYEEGKTYETLYVATKKFKKETLAELRKPTSEK